MVHALLASTSLAQSATIVDFDQPLSSYPGVFFSPTITPWSSASSVINNPNGGPITVPGGICAGPCGGGIIGTITFASPQTSVGIYALSGPGPDLVNPGTWLRAFDSGNGLIDADQADSSGQYDFVSVRGSGIARVEITSVPANNEAWDELIYSTSGFMLHAAPRSLPVGTNCEFVMAKQPQGVPMLLVAVGVLGVPINTIVAIGGADARGRWSYRISNVPDISGLGITFRGYSLDAQNNLIQSNDVAVTIQ